MSVEKEIVDFWDNKELYKSKGILKEKAREYYSEEFMNKYSKWSENLFELNKVIKAHLEGQNFPMQYWSEMSYDWFCSRINDLIEEWITVNNDILFADISLITEKLIGDFLSECIMKYKENAFKISALLESIKRVVMI